ncbi:DUF3604 domain-containing protein [Alphaproteobacteria bacterium]|nr:DUF3604 domain-containing protein [Alphaproteobacteria bacterium]
MRKNRSFINGASCAGFALAVCFMAGSLSDALAKDKNERVLLWGDTHLHTKYSGDAYALRNWSVTPDDAYRFAKGEPVAHAFSKARMQLKTPLDFLVVTDHAEYMGVMQLVENNSEALAKTEIGKILFKNRDDGNLRKSFVMLASSLNNDKPEKGLLTKDIRQPIWDIITSSADRHNEPGAFTALIGWEWSSMPQGANLHRIIFTPDNASLAQQYLPFSSLSDNRPEGLWNWLDKTSETHNARFVAIPHNSNISLGRMFSDVKSDGTAIDAAYAEMRMKWEPVVEMVQVKGTSETHPSLSPDDPFAGFELYEKVMDFTRKIEGGTGVRGNYARDALRRGLEIEQTEGENPYKFGMIGSTDSHTGMSTAEEDNFGGKYPIDGIPSNKFDQELTPNAFGVDMNAQGLAAIWADENTRDGVYDAFRRKEVYGTSGPRIQLRFFGGWSFSDADARAADLAKIGYQKGIPMGGDLPPAPANKAPSFIIHAAKDPVGANIERIQVVKGWVDASGQSYERVYDVVLSDARVAKGAKITSPIRSTVSVEHATYTNDVGAVQLSAKWTDPDFDASQNAFYYARVLEIKTPRHSVYDAVAMQRKHPAKYDVEIQERAYSSPIWYNSANR